MLIIKASNATFVFLESHSLYLTFGVALLIFSKKFLFILLFMVELIWHTFYAFQFKPVS